MARPVPIRRVAGPAASGFAMSVKAPRGLTHGKKLYAPEQWVDRIAAGWHELRNKRAVLLVVFAAHRRQQGVWDSSSTGFRGGSRWLWSSGTPGVEKGSGTHDDVFDLLARHQAAYCVMSGAGLPCVLRATAPVVYVRMHGPDPASPVRRVLPGHGPAVVGRPGSGMGRDGQGRVRLFQQRR